jgi:hypothetical protein
MPFFKSTYNVLVQQDKDEVFNANWMDSDKLITPPKTDWSYDREMKIEDVNIWEVLYEASAGIGLYVSWDPYAEFYLLTTAFDEKNGFRWIEGSPYVGRIYETYYGAGAQDKVIQRARELNIPLNFSTHWIENDQMWLYEKPEPKLIVV